MITIRPYIINGQHDTPAYHLWEDYVALYNLAEQTEVGSTAAEGAWIAVAEAGAKLDARVEELTREGSAA